MEAPRLFITRVPAGPGSGFAGPFPGRYGDFCHSPGTFSMAGRTKPVPGLDGGGAPIPGQNNLPTPRDGNPRVSAYGSIVRYSLPEEHRMIKKGSFHNRHRSHGHECRHCLGRRGWAAWDRIPAASGKLTRSSMPSPLAICCSAPRPWGGPHLGQIPAPAREGQVNLLIHPWQQPYRLLRSGPNLPIAPESFLDTGEFVHFRFFAALYLHFPMRAVIGKILCKQIGTFGNVDAASDPARFVPGSDIHRFHPNGMGTDFGAQFFGDARRQDTVQQFFHP